MPDTENRTINRMAGVVVALKAYQDRTGCGPTIRELMASVGARDSRTFVAVLQRLSQEKLIQWEPGRSRTLRLTERGTRVLTWLAGGVREGPTPATN